MRVCQGNFSQSDLLLSSIKQTCRTFFSNNPLQTCILDQPHSAKLICCFSRMTNENSTFSLDEVQATNNGTQVSIVGKDLESIPAGLYQKFGSSIASIDLSFNQIQYAKIYANLFFRTIENVDKFSKLKSLVLDNNNVQDVSQFPSIPTLETLWLNNNNIIDLDALLDVIEKRLPNLTYLSILKNPACPNEFTGNGTDDYQRYRYNSTYNVQ